MVNKLIDGGIVFQKHNSSFFKRILSQKMLKLYYSNFDKHHYEYAHRTQCTVPAPLAINFFRSFLSNSAKFSVVIEFAVGHSFLCKSLTRRCHGRRLVGKCKILFANGNYWVHNIPY